MLAGVCVTDLFSEHPQTWRIVRPTKVKNELRGWFEKATAPDAGTTVHFIMRADGQIAKLELQFGDGGDEVTLRHAPKKDEGISAR